jgi:hypothetical protein
MQSILTVIMALFNIVRYFGCLQKPKHITTHTKFITTAHNNMFYKILPFDYFYTFCQKVFTNWTNNFTNWIGDK